MLDNLFGGEDQEISKVEVLQSLLDEDGIIQKSDYNMTQIRILTLLDWHLENIKDGEKKDPAVIFQEVLDRFSSRMCSLKRKSREEVTRTIAAMKEEPVEPSMANMAGKR